MRRTSRGGEAPSEKPVKKNQPIKLFQVSNPEDDAVSDYNGFHLVPQITADEPYQIRNRKEVTNYDSREALAAAAGFEGNSIDLPGFDAMFVQVPAPKKDERYTLAGLDFRLKDGPPAIDAGVVIPNINEDFAGKAPDLGPDFRVVEAVPSGSGQSL